jgi:solute carrier family 30 (zinc transporter), member 9
MFRRKLSEHALSAAKQLPEFETQFDRLLRGTITLPVFGSRSFSHSSLHSFKNIDIQGLLLNNTMALHFGRTIGSQLNNHRLDLAAPLVSLRGLHYSPGFASAGLLPLPKPRTYRQTSSSNKSSFYSRNIHFSPQRSMAAAVPSRKDEKNYTRPTEQAREPSTEDLAKQKRELRAVNVAVGVNFAIFLAKVATWGFTRSGALLAEALHSLADIVNQLLLRAGVNQSRRPATFQHPYGFHREKYIYALMSAVGVFCLGAGASVVHGIQSLMDPPALEHMGYSLAVLAISAVAECYSLRVALGALRTGAKIQGTSLHKYLMSSNDPTTAAVLAEDAGAVAGLGIAGVASYMTYVTGDPLYDAVGSIAVGCLMGAVAVMLIRNNKKFLIGQAMRPEQHDAIIKHLKSDKMVLAVIDPKSEEIGDGVYRFKAEIQWSGDRVVNKYLGSLGRDSLYGQIRNAACTTPNSTVNDETLRNAMDLAMMEFGRGVIRTVGEEIDRLECELRELCPGLYYVDLETDKGRTEKSGSGTLECIINAEEMQMKEAMAVGELNSGESFPLNTSGGGKGAAPAAGAA